MKGRLLTAALGFLILGVWALNVAPSLRIPWVIFSLLVFGGILLFDSASQIQSTWMNTILFLGIFALVLQGVLETSAEIFWRDFSGAAFLTALLFEMNSLAWSGRGFVLRSTVPSSALIFVLVAAQNLPYFSAETTLTLSLVSIFLFAAMELFSILRENNDMNTGSFMSALRMACCGIGSLFFSKVFLPEVAQKPPFIFLNVGLPVLALIIATFGLFLKQWRRRYILFGCNWSLFVLWAAFSGEANRFYAATAALLAGVWTVMMTDKANVDPTNTRDLYLKLSGWGVPGTFLFSMIVFSLVPSANELVREGAALWLLTFFVYWSGLRRFEFSKTSKSLVTWSWRNGLALMITILGAGALAAARVFPIIMATFWGEGR